MTRRHFCGRFLYHATAFIILFLLSSKSYADLAIPNFCQVLRCDAGGKNCEETLENCTVVEQKYLPPVKQTKFIPVPGQQGNNPSPPGNLGSGSTPGDFDGAPIGEPILPNGEMFFQKTDFSFPGFGPDLVFTRTYRSHADYLGVLGHGWSFNLEKRIYSAKRDTGYCGYSYFLVDGQLGMAEFNSSYKPVEPGIGLT
ncbi:DUF6531 domain-containing protein [bacterium]|nr:DUF6531 domain-containing protein [bacterium]